MLRRLKDDEVLRPADANATTVKALERQGLIRPGYPLTIVWHLTKKKISLTDMCGRNRVWRGRQILSEHFEANPFAESLPKS